MSRLWKPKGSLWLPVFKPAMSFGKKWFPCCGGTFCVNQLCKFADRPDQMIVDLGAGGWIDTSRCDSCDQIAGQYTLDVNPNTSCEWIYEEEDPCAGCGGCTETGLAIILSVGIHDAPANHWRFELCVKMSWGSTTDTDSVAEAWSSITSDNTDCFFLGGTGVGDKLQMDSDIHTFDICGGSSGRMCTGNLPDPVFIWEP